MVAATYRTFTTAALLELRQFVCEHDVILVDHAVDRDDVAVHPFEQCAYRGDPDPHRRPAVPSGRLRASSVKSPNGPSATTRVPTGMRPIRRVWSPAAFAVMRNDRPSGAAAEKRERMGCPTKCPGVRTAR